MRILFNKLGDYPEDISNYRIVENYDITQEKERTAFQRTCSDVTLKVTNIDHKFDDIKHPPNSTARWEVRIIDVRKLFIGELDNYDFDIKDKSVSLTFFSKEKIFWEWAKTAHIIKKPLWLTPRQYDVTPVSLTDILTMNLLPPLQLGLPDGLFNKIELGDDLASLHGVTYHGFDTTHGRYWDLMPDTTIEKLLEFFAITCNAEYEVDAESGTFKMRTRGFDDATEEREISGLVSNKHEINISKADIFDVVKMYTPLPAPSPPTLSGIIEDYNAHSAQLSNDVGWMIYAISAVIEYTHETPLSLLLFPPDNTYDIIKAKEGGGIVSLFIPAFDESYGNVTSRRIYRGNGNLLGSYPKPSVMRFVGDIGGNAHNSIFREWICCEPGYVDKVVIHGDRQYYNFIYGATGLYIPPKPSAPAVPGHVKAWLPYNRSTEIWDSLVVDNGYNTQPPGRIHDTTISLRFGAPSATNPNVWEEFPSSGLENFFLWDFFYNNKTMKDRMLKLVRNASLLQASLNTLDIKIGDSLLYSELAHPIKHFTVEKAIQHSEEKITEVYAVSK